MANSATVLPSAVFFMAHEGDEGDAQALAKWLDEGGGVDSRCEELGSATLLIGAANGGGEQVTMVRMLLQRGASVNLRDSLGFTALTYAALKGYTTIVQALLDAKADPSLQTKGGRTALMGAEHHDHAEIALLLRKVSPSPNLNPTPNPYPAPTPYPLPPTPYP